MRGAPISRRHSCMKSPSLLTLLLVINVLLGSTIGWLTMHDEHIIAADHLQGMRIDVQGNGLLYVDLGASSTPSGPVALNPRKSGTLILTPRAAIQMEVELQRIIKTVQSAAEARTEGQRSADPSL